MKRSLLAASGGALAMSLTLLAAAPAHAQTTLGVRGGISVASASFDTDTFDASNRTGFVGGVFLDFGGSNLFGFQVGAQYSQKGAEFDAGATVEELSLNYLEIPAVLKVGLPLGALKPSIFAGAALGFNTGCEGGSGEDCGDDVTSTDFSGVVGADLAIFLGGLSLWADARYNVGLSDIPDGDAFGDFKNRAFNLTAGLGFPIG
jgi:hypothetical protein